MKIKWYPLQQWLHKFTQNVDASRRCDKFRNLNINFNNSLREADRCFFARFFRFAQKRVE